jgi:hypothetical protein
MQCVFSVLGAVASGYTFTQMVAGDVTDPCERRRCSLFKTASLRAPWSTDKSNDNIPAENDSHCDSNMSARDASHRSRVHNQAEKRLPIPWATGSARHTSKASAYQTLATSDIKATFKEATTKSMRLRGAGDESQEELNALETLSGNGCATFKRVMRKLIVMTYNEGIGITEVLDNYTLQQINAEVGDEEVEQAVWDSYGAYLCWAEDDDDDQQYYESEDYDDDDDDDEYYDADEWSEGQILVGSLKIWNEDRNYGVIVVVDDYTTQDMQEGQIFCHGTNFSDDEETTGMYVDNQLVWFTVAWDNTRNRWQAINISQATFKEYQAYEEENSMSEKASEFFVDCVIGQAYDGI